LGAGNGDDLEKEFLADETARDRFALFWEAIAGLGVKALSCFQE